MPIKHFILFDNNPHFQFCPNFILYYRVYYSESPIYFQGIIRIVTRNEHKYHAYGKLLTLLNSFGKRGG